MERVLYNDKTPPARAKRVRTKRGKKARAAAKYILSPTRAARYTVQAAALVLLASVDVFGGALALGLFAGLCYARQNLTFLAPVYALAVIAFSPSPWTVLYVAVPILLFVAVYVIFYRLRKNVHILFTTLAAVLAELPEAVLKALFGGSVTASVLCLVLSGVFAFCAQTVCYALLLRGIKTRFTPDELIAGGLCVIVFAYAAAGVGVDGFHLLFLLFPFLLMFAVCGAPPSSAFAFAVLTGIGGALVQGGAEVIAFAVFAAGAAFALLPFTKWVAALGPVAAYAAVWLIFSPSGWGWQDLLAVALGAGAFLMLPGKYATVLSSGKGKAAAVSIVNRARSEMSARLMSASKVFYDMSNSMRELESRTAEYTPEKLAREVAKNYCGRCGDRESCYAALDGDTSSVILPMAEAAMTRGKVTILDMPPFITSRCPRMYNLSSVVTSAAEAYRRRADEAGGLNETKRLMSEQFAGVSLVLDSLARECGERVSFGEEGQERISAELLRHNIAASEIVICGEGVGASVAVTVRASDADKLILPRILSSCMGIRMERVGVTRRGEESVVHIAACPVFEVAYGVARKSREGTDASGDTTSVLCPSRKRRLFAISDGMGSGERAARSSRDAIAMVENFYRAGFDDAVILTLVNKLLCLTSDENFSSLDISVIDTVSGGLNIIKMGAVSTFVCHRDGMESISCAAPPAGILERAAPLTCRRQLYDGDMVIMMSDGVYDALDEQGVAAVTEEASTSNPQVLADRLLERAVSSGASDDCTVLVMRVFLR